MQHQFILVRRPADGPPALRGIFTTLEKAQNHDPVLKGTWGEGLLGSRISHRESLTNKHTIHAVPLNEELKVW